MMMNFREEKDGLAEKEKENVWNCLEMRSGGFLQGLGLLDVYAYKNQRENYNDLPTYLFLIIFMTPNIHYMTL